MAGCGDGDDDSATLSKQQYEEQYREAVAGDAADLSGALDGGPAKDPEATAATYARLSDLSAAQVARLGALEPPVDIAAEHRAYVGLLGRVSLLYADIAARIRANPDPDVTEAQVKRIVELFAAPRNAAVVTDFTRAVEAGGYDLGVSLSQPSGSQQDLSQP